jgi:hypothetical protein
MRKTFINILLIILFCPAYSQVSPKYTKFALKDSTFFHHLDSVTPRLDTDSFKIWVKGGEALITLSQISFTNWTAGGENSISGIGNLLIFANRKKGKNTWDNSLNIVYGLLTQGGDIRKTEDRIDLVSQINRYIKNDWYYSLMIQGKTQLRPGYDYPNDSVIISNFMAPGYILTTMGWEYRSSKKLKLTIAPLSGKITIVADQNLANKGAFGVIKGTLDELGQFFETLGKNLKYEFGAFTKFIYSGKLTDMIRLNSRLDLFTAYNKSFGNIDVDWQAEAKFQFTEVISMNVFTHLIYDDDVNMKISDSGEVLEGPRVQFKEMLGFGFTFRF